MEETKQVMTPEQLYLQGLLDKFNTNPEDPTLQQVERVLLKKLVEVHKNINDLSGQINTLNEEIKEKQQKGNALVQQVTHLQGQSQGYLDSLLALR